MIDGFRSHVTREHTAIGGESSDGDTDVVIDFEDLPLVRRELRLGFIDGGEDDMGARSEPDCGGALLDGFHGVLYLEKTTGGTPCCHVCVVLVPEHPCFFFFVFVRQKSVYREKDAVKEEKLFVWFGLVSL